MVLRASKRQKTSANDGTNEPPPPIPVTILSGFLGSGKTTLLKHILTSKDHQLRIAVIVNDMAELNIDGQTIIQTTPEKKDVVVTLENGCICCTLRGDLIREIHRLQQSNNFDYVLIESTGIAEPQQVAESFCVDPATQEVAGNDASMLWNSSRLDTCVTVVDAVHFPKYLSSLKRFQDEFKDGLEISEKGEGEKSISELMVEQVEFANVVLLNKIDLASSQDVSTAHKLIQALNPKARVISASYGKIDLTDILNTGLFNLEEAEQSPGWLLSLKDGIDAAAGEADEYGVTSFVYRRRRPFHPKRLKNFLSTMFCFAEDWNRGKFDDKDDGNKSTSNFGQILRSKGTCWIAGRDDHEMAWAQTGRIIQITPTRSWYCKRPQEEWECNDNMDDEEGDDQTGADEERQRIQSLFLESPDDPDSKYKFGDRRQEFVVIGTDLDKAALEAALDECLLDDSEFQAHSPALPLGSYDDPLAPILIELEGSSNLFLKLRPGIPQHLRVCPGSKATIQSLALHLTNNNDNEERIRAVKVWLDKTDKINDERHGLLLATLRPWEYDQHSLNLELLPLDEYIDEKGTNRRLRLQVIPKPGMTVNEHLLDAVEVHVLGAVEPLQYSQEPDDDSDSDDEHDNDDCPDGHCQQ